MTKNDSNKDKIIIEEGVFIFENPNNGDSIMVPYELREGESFEEERSKVEAEIFKGDDLK